MPSTRRDRGRAAFEQFVAETTDRLLLTTYLVSGDAGHAEDLVQESLFKVARRWSRVVSMDSPQAYARRVLVNLALDSSERRSVHRAELGASTDPTDGRQWESQLSRHALTTIDERMELIRALGALAPRQRATLVLRYFDDLSEAEVASTLGCSVGTVKSTTSRALEKMRALVPEPDVTIGSHPRVLACQEKGQRP